MDVSRQIRFPHRGGLTDHTGALRPDSTLIERIGGRAMIERIIDTFYEGVLTDPLLMPIFRQHFDRGHSKDFFAEWMGGEPCYSRSPEHWRGTLRAHARFFITRPMAGRWVFHMKNALLRCGVSPALRREIIDMLVPLAQGLANNERARPEDVHLSGHGMTIQSPAFWHIEKLRMAARHGDLDAIRAASEASDDPAVLARQRGSNGRTLLWEAAGAGHQAIVDFLLDLGAPVDLPGCAPMPEDFFVHADREPGPLIMTSPYALARVAGHHAVADRLLERGAIVDIFTAAYAGELDHARAFIANQPAFVHAEDPADDFHRVTALHHAIAGGQRAVAELLVQHGASVRPHSMWLLTLAALHHGDDQDQRAALIALLLDHGADASQALSLGPLDTDHRPVADTLIARGADIERHPAHGSMLYHVCRRGADPAMVRNARALIGYGADVNALAGWDDTPLHAAVRSGSLELVELLLGAGADPDRCNHRNQSARELARRSRKARAAGIADLMAHWIERAVAHGAP